MRGPAITDQLATLLDLDPIDRRDAEALLLVSGASPDVTQALDVLNDRLGHFPDAPPRAPRDEKVWICATLRFAAVAAQWCAEQSIDPAVTAATFADVGRHLRLNRRTHGVFGLETWAFLTHHLAGGLFALGRLQFALRRLLPEEPWPPTEFEGGWVLDVHIPSSGPLTPESVLASFDEAVTFFTRHFPDRPAPVAVCFSWLLDPYLTRHLDQGANIALFQRFFQPYGQSRPSQAEVLYFVFGTRDMSELDILPRDTALQRLVLDRIAGGGTWQFSRGFRALPPPAR